MSNKVRKLHVLIVDDNEGDRFLYKDLLTAGNPNTEFVFDEVDTGKLALEKLRSEKPACLLLDYRLPDMYGLDILKKLSEQDGSSPIPVVMLTGFGDENTAVRALHMGAHDYLPKRDLTKEKLCEVVNNAMSASKKLLEFKNSRRQLEIQNQDLADKYGKVETFYKKVLRKLKSPVTSSREISCKILDELEGTLSDEQISSLETIKHSCDQLTANINNLIDNPGLEMGEMLISTRPENPMEVVSGVTRKLKEQFASRQIKLSSKMTFGLPEVYMDRYRIEQVLSNLLDNAFKFTDSGGKIEVTVNRLRESYDRLTFSISDTGKGIESKFLEKIFERSFQVPNNGSENQSGLGLGLHICREILLSHKGEIFASSTPGEGSCFTFTLPLPLSIADEIIEVDDWSGRAIKFP